MFKTNNKLRSHNLYLSGNEEEFLTLFNKECGKPFIEYVRDVVDANIHHIMLVGSIPLHTATSASDIDIFVTIDDTKSLEFHTHKADSATVFRNPSGGLMRAQVVTLLNGVEIDLYVLDISVLKNVFKALSVGNLHLSQFDIKIIALLKNVWILYQNSIHFLDPPDDAFDVFCSTRSYTFAAQEYNDAVLSSENDKELTIHLCRSVVQHLINAYMAQQGVCFLGVKWIKKIRKHRQKLEKQGCSDEIMFIDRILYLLFGNDALSVAEIRKALHDIHSLILVGRSLIEKNPFFAAAFAGSKNIPDIKLIYL